MKKILNKIVLLLKQILQNEIQNKIFFNLRNFKMKNKNMKEYEYYILANKYQKDYNNYIIKNIYIIWILNLKIFYMKKMNKI